jgi:L-fucose isomerase-like protein
MYLNNNLKPKIGLITLMETPRALAFTNERENAISKKHNDYKSYLLNNDIEVIDASEHIDKQNDGIGFFSSDTIQKAVDLFLLNHVEAIVIGCWHWTEPMFIVEIARAANKPIMLYSDEDPAWAATCLLTAGGASLWETSPNRPAQLHERFYGDKEGSLKWLKGVCALEKMKKMDVILWGGSYSLRMEYLQDDFPKLKSFLISDIIIEDQYVLINSAEKISKERIDKFIKWLNYGKAKLIFDNKMFTKEVLRKQIALYLAAKDRIGDFNKNIAGVSVKCFNELSDIYGVDGCFIPAFIPYNEDSEGDKIPINAICEGDIKGLLTMILLSNISGGVPALFGDLTYIGKEYLIISNCGASSVYYSCGSCNAMEMLKNITIEANCEGLSGGAVGYKCPEGDMTVARLVRSKGKYFMHLGLVKALKISDKISSKFYYGNTWPHTAVSINADQQLLVKAFGANHLVAIGGDFTKEMIYACNLAGIEVFRIDSDSGINDWLKKVRSL